MGVSRSICLSWPQTSILPISAPQVAKIIGVSHWHPVKISILYTPVLYFTVQMQTTEEKYKIPKIPKVQLEEHVLGGIVFIFVFLGPEIEPKA
jgi:hypothetical protein